MHATWSAHDSASHQPPSGAQTQMDQLPSESFAFAKTGVRVLESGEVAKENLENHAVSFDAAVGKTPVTSVSLLIGQSKSLGPCNLKGWGRECSVTTTSVQFSHSVPQLCPTLRTHELQHARPPNSRSSPKLTCIKSVMPSSHLILCCPLLLSPIPPSIRVFSNESTLRMRWPN